MSAWFAAMDDRLNPILVKEVRQSLRSRSTLLVIGAALLVQLFALYLFAVNDSSSPGASFFGVIMTVFIFGSFILCAVFCQRFSLERREDNLDYTYITTLSPLRIVSGKFVSVLVMELMLFSLCLPFFVMSYYLGGIDLSTILLRSAMVLLLMLPCIMLGLLIGSSGKKGSVVLFVLLCFVVNIFLTVFLMQGADRNFFPLILVASLWALALLGVLTVAAISNLNANRVGGMRIFLAVSAVAGFPVFELVAGRSIQYKVTDYAGTYFCWWIAISALLTMISSVEPSQPSRRILAELHSSSPVIYWLRRLFSGAAVSGFLLGLLLLALASGGMLWLAKEMSQECYSFVSFGGYAVFYAGFTIFLNRVIEHWTSRFSGIGCLIITGIIFCAVPVLTSVLFRSDLASLSRPPWEMWGAVFCLQFQDYTFVYHVSLCLALAGILFALPSMIAYFRLKKE